MSSDSPGSRRPLPDRANLDHLKHEAKALLKAYQSGDADARSRIQATLGDRAAIKLTDAQRVIAREYGFPTWARLRSHVLSSRDATGAVDAFLSATHQQDIGAARRVIDAHPQLAHESLHVAATLGDADAARRLVDEDATLVHARAGVANGEPLLYLSFSPFHGESAARDAGLLATARLLLASGANPNTTGGEHSLPVLFAVTGMHNVPAIARLLLDAGANPTDGESVFHAAEKFHVQALEMLLAAGAKLNEAGEWGNTPLYFLLRWWDLDREPQVRRGVDWLLAHGADPNVLCGRERENALHAAIRRRQPLELIARLIEHGADVNLARGDGATPWRLAARGGFDDVAAMLERAGAIRRPMSAADRFLAACGRGDVEEAKRLGSRALIQSLPDVDRLLLVNAAASGQTRTVIACLAAGFPVNERGGAGETATHHASIWGRAEEVRAFIEAGADLSIRDNEHDSTPLGWAVFGADFYLNSTGDYPATVRALVAGGSPPMWSDEYISKRADVREALGTNGIILRSRA